MLRFPALLTLRLSSDKSVNSYGETNHLINLKSSQWLLFLFKSIDVLQVKAMEITKAQISDFLQIAELDRIAWLDNGKSEFIPDGEHAWRLWVEHALVVCAKEGQQIFGVALAFPSTNNTYCLHKVFVAKGARGKGLGRKLMSTLNHDFDQLSTSAFLTVDPNNTNAIDLYRKLGFTLEKYVEGYYRPQEHRIVLTRPAKSV